VSPVVSRRLFLLPVAIALVLAVPSPAAAKVKTYDLRFGPVAMGSFNVSLPRGVAKTPRVNGDIVRMHADLVDRKGRRVTIRDVMLHHVFISQERAAMEHWQCAGAKDEVFYGTGEENQSLRLPRGYGYPIRRGSAWHLKAMLMSHSLRQMNVYVRYRVTVHTGSRLTPVHPFWLRAKGCERSVAYPIEGDRPAGSTDLRRSGWRVPYSGRIVAVGGHLHGGAKNMWLSQPRCGGRRLLDTRPFYGMPDNLYYRARPILHEPGPVDTHYFMSRKGIPVVRGEVLQQSATYDAAKPRWGVMSTMHVYVAEDNSVPQACSPLPADRRQLRKYRRVRLRPPYTPIPLTGLNDAGHTYTIAQSPFPAQPLNAPAVIRVGNAGFSPPHVSVAAGARVTWRFLSGTHNVRLASGPRLIGTQSRPGGSSQPGTFPTPGHYELFCTLHPITMHQVVEVLPRAGSTATQAASRPAGEGRTDPYDELW
jgi:plastocyanin